MGRKGRVGGTTKKGHSQENHLGLRGEQRLSELSIQSHQGKVTALAGGLTPPEDVRATCVRRLGRALKSCPEYQKPVAARRDAAAFPRGEKNESVIQKSSVAVELLTKIV